MHFQDWRQFSRVPDRSAGEVVRLTVESLSLMVALAVVMFFMVKDFTGETVRNHESVAGEGVQLAEEGLHGRETDAHQAEGDGNSSRDTRGRGEKNLLARTLAGRIVAHTGAMVLVLALWVVQLRKIYQFCKPPTEV